MEFNLKETIKRLDNLYKDVPSVIYVNHNSGNHRDLHEKLIKDLMLGASEQGWYQTSIWVTGSRTADWINIIYDMPVIKKGNTINQPFVGILYDRPLLVHDDYITTDYIPRLYLVNYGVGQIGAVLGDLQ